MITLVDTSVWIDHLRKGNKRLATLLDKGGVCCHRFVIGELACGTLRNRDELLGLLGALPAVQIAEHEEVLNFIDERKLAGRGLGWIDMHLLALNRSYHRDDAGTIRPLLLALFLLGTLGIAIELVLLGHYENPWQWTPLGMLALGLMVLAARYFLEASRVLRIFQLTMVLFVISGCLGIFLHYGNNREFELEIYPSMEGAELIWESLTGAMPALAPGTMIQLGLVGLLYTYRHPVFSNTRLATNRGNGGES